MEFYTAPFVRADSNSVRVPLISLGNLNIVPNPYVTLTIIIVSLHNPQSIGRLSETSFYNKIKNDQLVISVFDQSTSNAFKEVKIFRMDFLPLYGQLFLHNLTFDKIITKYGILTYYSIRKGDLVAGATSGRGLLAKISFFGVLLA